MAQKGEELSCDKRACFKMAGSTGRLTSPLYAVLDFAFQVAAQAIRRHVAGFVKRFALGSQVGDRR